MNFFNAYVASEAVASEAVPGRRSILFFPMRMWRVTRRGSINSQKSVYSGFME